MNIWAFIDTNNLYYNTTKRYKKKINFDKLIAYIDELGEVHDSIAYIAQTIKMSQSFAYALSKKGITVKTNTTPSTDRRMNWNAGIAVDVFKATGENMDTLIFCSADNDLIPLYEFIKELDPDIQIIVIACNISRRIKEVVTETIEIPRTWLY
jgi:uncharacterized LabA/DUF88 family protein